MIIRALKLFIIELFLVVASSTRKKNKHNFIITSIYQKKVIVFPCLIFIFFCYCYESVKSWKYIGWLKGLWNTLLFFRKNVSCDFAEEIVYITNYHKLCVTPRDLGYLKNEY